MLEEAKLWVESAAVIGSFAVSMAIVRARESQAKSK
jgi:hypothetical protein